jgi:hypothetical protein
MKCHLTRITKTCALLGVLSLQALALSPANALAAPQPTVVAAAAATHLTGPINVYPAAQVLNPYQIERAAPDSAACAPQCVLTFPTVPDGKRLVITNVSAQVGTSISNFVIEGNGVAYFVPKPYPTASYLNAPVTVYFEPGSSPTARFFVQNAAEHTSLVVTFVGYFVPAK